MGTICLMNEIFRQKHLKRINLSRCFFPFFLLLCVQTNTFAAETESTQPVEKILINADHMKLNIESGNAIYTGNVKISQGALVLTGDKVTLEQANDVLERITVIGKPAHYNHVTETGESIQAESEHMVYNASQNKLVMTINAKLLQPDHKVSSQKITYDTDKRIVIAGDKNDTSTDSSDINQRVNITLTPKKETQP